MATNDGSGAKRTEAQPARPQAPAGGDNKATPPAESRRGGETLPQATAAYLGPKHGLPQVFGRYRVQKQLGGGGMGAVFLVVNTELQREEALKVPHFEAADDPEVHERFLREARAAAGLDHPNLCPVYDVGVLDGIYYLTMRYLKGKLLSDHTGTAQPVRKAVEIVTKLAQALSAAHAKGVIHRDLKPNNVMMCPGVGPVVMDFGLAKQKQGENQKLTQAGTTLGTPAYMPPEQVTGDLDRIGPASDVYSLGVILFELLTGRLPFRGKTVGEVYGNICHTEAPAPSSLRPGLNPVLDAICRKAMAKAPEDRYPSMKAFAAVLIDFLKAMPAGEGAGPLMVTKAGPADVFQVPTVAPGPAAVSAPNPEKRDVIDWLADVAPGPVAAPTPNPRIARTTNPAPKGGRAPSVVRTPVHTQRARAAGNVDEDRGGWTVGGVLGLGVLILLMLGTLGGVGYLVYLVRQNKAAPSSGPVAVVTPVNEKAPEVPNGAAPKADPAGEDNSNSDPLKVNPPAAPPAPGPHPAPKVHPPKSDPPPPGGGSVPTGGSRPPGDPAPKPSGPAGPGGFGPFGPGGFGPAGPGAPKTDPAPKPSGPAGPGGFGPAGPGAPKTDPVPKPTPHVAPKPVDTDPGVLLNEDFREVDVGGRPKDWEGDAFAVQTEDGLSCLEVTNETPDQYYIKLPRVFVKGDFTLESDFRLGQHPYNPDIGQHLNLELRSRSSTPLPITVGHSAHVGLDGALKEAKEFKAMTNIHFRLTRKGDVYNVSINGEVVVGKTIPDKGAFEEVRIGLTGGKSTIRARIYSIKITSLEKDVPKPAAGAAPLPGIREDFSKAAAGSLPDGWTAGKTANLAVQKSGDNGDLELVNPALGGDAVMLPKIELKGDFYADVAAVLTERDTAVEVFFKGAKTKTLAIELGYRGAVTVAGLPKADGSKSWIAGKPNVLRVERSGKEKGYVIKLNDTAVGAVPLAVAPGPFTEVDLAVVMSRDAERSDFVLGRDSKGGGKNKTPQITSVQVVPLEDAPAP